MKRRYEQLSLLTLMGQVETAGERYARTAHVVPGSDRVDEDGNVLDVTVCCEEDEHECDSSDPWQDQEAPYEET